MRLELNFLYRFSKNTHMSNIMKIRPVGAGLFHADGRTDRWAHLTKLIVAVRNFADVTKTGCRTLLQIFVPIR